MGEEMKIQEAIKSGKPFRRKEWKAYFLMLGDGWLKGSDDDNYTQLKKIDILAEDWETKE